MRCAIIKDVMGQIIIEIPQDVSRTYRIVSEDSAKKLLSNLERILKRENAIDEEDILSLWTISNKTIKKTAS